MTRTLGLCYGRIMEVLESDTVNQVKALVPAFIDSDEEKRDYLSWRICGFSPKEAMHYTNIRPVELQRWFQTDEAFARVETEQLPTLRKEAVQEVLNQEQLRNSRKVQQLDADVLNQALVGGIDTLGKNSVEYLKLVRTQYNPQIRKMLGLEGDERMPSFEEVVIRYRRGFNGQEPSNTPYLVKDEHQKGSTE